MKILITGAGGQLGKALCRQIDTNTHTLMALQVKDCDITKKDQVDLVFDNYKPNIVFNCAAFTAVDLAENQPEQCNLVNVTGTMNAMEACRKSSSKLIHISTDYVFSGEKKTPYEITDKPSPINVYGKSKYLAEKLLADSYDKYFIIRTAWMFGDGKNFVDTMLKLAKTNNSLNVVCDQFGSPTYATDLASLILDMSSTEKYGLYHATNEGFCSWADFAEEIFNQKNIPIKVNRVTSNEYVTKAHRPANGVLSKKSLDDNGFIRLSKWQDALTRYLQAI